MNYEWSDYFRYICSMHSSEIARRLSDTDYKAICDELKHASDKDAYIEIAEKKAACYYEQAAIVALKHFIKLSQEIGTL